MSHNPDTYYSRSEVSNSDLTELKNILHPRMQFGDKEAAFRFGSLVDAIITEPARVDYYRLTVDDEQYTEDEFRHAQEMQKALRMMVELLVERMNKPEEKTVAIVHCNNEARAQFVKEEIEKRTKVKEIIILPSSGVSTLYAAQGGIILVG